MARAVALLAGLPDAAGTTVNRYCASSLQAIRIAMHAILAGEGDAFVCAGVEAVSRFTKGKSDGLPDTKNPRFASGADRAAPSADAPSGATPPLPDVYIAMGETAERVADQEHVTRDEMDAFAVDLAGAGRPRPGGRNLRRRDRPGRAPGRYGRRSRRRPSPRHHPREARQARAGLPPRRPRHRGQRLPPQRRRRRGRRDEQHPRARARHSSTRAHRRERGLRDRPRADGPRADRARPAAPSRARR